MFSAGNETGARPEFQCPGLAANVQSAGGSELIVFDFEVRCIVVCAVIKQRPGGRPVMNAEFDLGILLTQNTVHEVLDPERAVNEAAQRRTALIFAGGRLTGRIDRQIHQEAQLDVVLRLLHQGNFSRDGGISGIACPLHRLAPGRFRIHIIAKGPQVAIAKRLEIDD